MNDRRIFFAIISLASALLLASILTIVFYPPSTHVMASATSPNTPIVVTIDPTGAPNDLNTEVVIAGTGFSAGVSGTVIITQPIVQLGNVTLADASWISSTLLTATLPWGLDPGVYTLTVTNPDGGNGYLPSAFTVTQGFDVWTTDGPYGGEIDQLAINPITQTILFANAPQVGLFHSLDNGEHWQQVTEVLGEARIAINASGNIIHAGGQSGWYRSGDGGHTWDHLFWLTGWLRNPVAHPISDTVFYATDACNEIYRSEDGGWNWISWSTGITDTTCGAGAHIAFDPTNPLTMYVGTPSGNLFRSTDGGASWAFSSHPVSALWTMAVNPFGDHELWISTDNRWGDQSTGVLKSANPDLTAWTQIEEEPGKMLLWARYIEFPPVTWGPTYSGTVYLPFGNHLKTSTDGGATWTVLDQDFFLQDLALYPTDTDRMFTGGNEGVHRSLDGGQTWSPTNDGLSAVTPGELATATTDPEMVCALDQGGVYVSERAGESWRRIGVTAEAVMVDPFASSRIYLGAGEGQNGRVYVSHDTGATWPFSGVLTATSPYSNCSALMEVLKADPVTPGRVLAGLGYFCGDWSNPAGSLYLSTDGGQNWSHLNVTDPMSQVNDILFDPQDPVRVYAGTWHSGVFTSTDSGATWHATSNLMSGINVGSLAAEPAAPYRVYAAAQYGSGVYRSDDGGVTWVQMTSPPGNIERRGLVILPGTPQVLYAATGSGLYWSDDGAQSWQPAAGALGQVQIHSLAVAADENRAILYVGTGGGVVSEAQYRAAANNETLVDAGVYRFATRLFSHHIFLPLVLK